MQGDAFHTLFPALRRHIWVLSRPDHMRHALVDCSANITKSIGIDCVAILLGNGLITSAGEIWRAQRRMLQPSFDRKIIATWMPPLHAENATLAGTWVDTAKAGTEVNVTPDTSKFTLPAVEARRDALTQQVEPTG